MKYQDRVELAAAIETLEKGLLQMDAAIENLEKERAGYYAKREDARNVLDAAKKKLGLSTSVQ